LDARRKAVPSTGGTFIPQMNLSEFANKT